MDEQCGDNDSFFDPPQTCSNYLPNFFSNSRRQQSLEQLPTLDHIALCFIINALLGANGIKSDDNSKVTHAHLSSNKSIKPSKVLSLTITKWLLRNITAHQRHLRRASDVSQTNNSSFPWCLREFVHFMCRVRCTPTEGNMGDAEYADEILQRLSGILKSLSFRGPAGSESSHVEQNSGAALGILTHLLEGSELLSKSSMEYSSGWMKLQFFPQCVVTNYLRYIRLLYTYTTFSYKISRLKNELSFWIDDMDILCPPSTAGLNHTAGSGTTHFSDPLASDYIFHVSDRPGVEVACVAPQVNLAFPDAINIAEAVVLRDEMEERDCTKAAYYAFHEAAQKAPMTSKEVPPLRSSMGYTGSGGGMYRPAAVNPAARYWLSPPFTNAEALMSILFYRIHRGFINNAGNNSGDCEWLAILNTSSASLDYREFMATVETPGSLPQPSLSSSSSISDLLFDTYTAGKPYVPHWATNSKTRQVGTGRQNRLLRLASDAVNLCTLVSKGSLLSCLARLNSAVVALHCNGSNAMPLDAGAWLSNAASKHPCQGCSEMESDRLGHQPDSLEVPCKSWQGMRQSVAQQLSQRSTTAIAVEHIAATLQMCKEHEGELARRANTSILDEEDNFRARSGHDGKSEAPSRTFAAQREGQQLLAEWRLLAEIESIALLTGASLLLHYPLCTSRSEGGGPEQVLDAESVSDGLAGEYLQIMEILLSSLGYSEGMNTTGRKQKNKKEAPVHYTAVLAASSEELFPQHVIVACIRRAVQLQLGALYVGDVELNIGRGIVLAATGLEQQGSPLAMFSTRAIVVSAAEALLEQCRLVFDAVPLAGVSTAAASSLVSISTTGPLLTSFSHKVQCQMAAATAENYFTRVIAKTLRLLAAEGQAQFYTVKDVSLNSRHPLAYFARKIMNQKSGGQQGAARLCQLYEYLGEGTRADLFLVLLLIAAEGFLFMGHSKASMEVGLLGLRTAGIALREFADVVGAFWNEGRTSLLHQRTEDRFMTSSHPEEVLSGFEPLDKLRVLNASRVDASLLSFVSPYPLRLVLIGRLCLITGCAAARLGTLLPTATPPPPCIAPAGLAGANVNTIALLTATVRPGSTLQSPLLTSICSGPFASPHGYGGCRPNFPPSVVGVICTSLLAMLTAPPYSAVLVALCSGDTRLGAEQVIAIARARGGDVVSQLLIRELTATIVKQCEFAWTSGYNSAAVTLDPVAKICILRSLNAIPCNKETSELVDHLFNRLRETVNLTNTQWADLHSTAAATATFCREFEESEISAGERERQGNVSVERLLGLDLESLVLAGPGEELLQLTDALVEWWEDNNSS